MLKFVSPQSLAIYNIILALALFLIPSEIYSEVVGEDFVFGGSWLSLALIMTSWLAFYIGGRVASPYAHGQHGPSSGPSLLFVDRGMASIGFLMSINFVMIVVSRQLVQDFYLSGEVFDIAGAGKEARREIQRVKGDFSLSFFLLMNHILAPLILVSILNAPRNQLKRGLVFIWIVTATLALLPLQSMGTLLFFYVTLIVPYLVHSKPRFSIWLLLGFIGLLAISFLFFGYVQAIRVGQISPDFYMTSLEKVLEYTGGSLNRYGALVEESLVFPGMYRGYYSTQFIWEFPVIGPLFLSDVARGLMTELPPIGYFERTYFITKAGLSSHLTSISAYGMLYVDFWVFFPLAFVVLGMTVQVVWVHALRKEAYALVLYPLFFWSLFEIRGYLEFARPSNALFYVVSFCLFTYERRMKVA
jgi:hypothetical protein